MKRTKRVCRVQRVGSSHRDRLLKTVNVPVASVKSLNQLKKLKCLDAPPTVAAIFRLRSQENPISDAFFFFLELIDSILRGRRATTSLIFGNNARIRAQKSLLADWLWLPFVPAISSVREFHRRDWHLPPSCAFSSFQRKTEISRDDSWMTVC